MIARVARWAAEDVPVWVWFVVLVLAFAALTGCAPRQAPPVFALAVPALPEESALVIPPDEPDACVPQAVIPGAPLPVTPGGAAVCRGQLVTDADVLGWLDAEDDAAYWRELAAVQHDARTADRLLCEDIAAQRWQSAEDWRHEARTLRWAGWGLGLAGLAVGVAMGFGAGVVTQ